VVLVTDNSIFIILLLIPRQNTTLLTYNKALRKAKNQATCFGPMGPSLGLGERTILKMLNGIPFSYNISSVYSYKM
jgi:hypothetical protein